MGHRLWAALTHTPSWKAADSPELPVPAHTDKGISSTRALSKQRVQSPSEAARLSRRPRKGRGWHSVQSCHYILPWQHDGCNPTSAEVNVSLHFFSLPPPSTCKFLLTSGIGIHLIRVYSNHLLCYFISFFSTSVRWGQELWFCWKTLRKHWRALQVLSAAHPAFEVKKKKASNEQAAASASKAKQILVLTEKGCLSTHLSVPKPLILIALHLGYNSSIACIQ